MLPIGENQMRKILLVFVALLGPLTSEEPIYFDTPLATQASQRAEEEPSISPTETIVMEEEPPPAPVDNSERRNWLFAAGTILIGTIAAIVVGWSQGNPPSGTGN
jgi:hypothetical protein